MKGLLTSLLVLGLLYGVCEAKTKLRMGKQKAGPYDKIWTLQCGHDYGAYQYIDSKGYLQGMAYDLMDQVCKEGDMVCDTVWDEYTECWQSPPGVHPHGGRGLHGRWYDACFGWWQTVERAHVFKFSKQYVDAPLTNLYVKRGSGILSSRPLDLAGKKVAFLAGWATDEKCLARMEEIVNNILPVENILHFPTTDSAVGAIQDGRVDAVFSTYEGMHPHVAAGKVDEVTLDHSCLIGGSSVMERKDGKFTAVWDKAFQNYVDSGKYAAFCRSSSIKHADRGKIACLKNA